MLCEHCKKEQATVYVTRIVNDHKNEIHLCSQCALDQGELSGSMEPGFTFHNILASLFDPDSTFMASGTHRGIVRCSGCGLSLADLRRIGKVGCGQCYTEFERELEPLLRRIHRSVEHVGKVPKSAGEDQNTLRVKLDHLRAKLQEAVEKENFEEAARLRDEAREIERKLESQ